MAHDLAAGWTFHTTVYDIYPFEENPQKHGVLLRVEVLNKPIQKKDESTRQRQSDEWALNL
jgi:hypothetical protein